MESVSTFTSIAMIVTTLLAVAIFYIAAQRSNKFLLATIVWLLLQAALATAGFYEVVNTVPPRFILLPGPPVVAIIVLFSTAAGRRFIDGLDAKWLTLLHTVRIAVEIILLMLYLQGAVPGIMTFEVSNFDILAGVSALLIFYFAYIKKKIGRYGLLIWNLLCLALLINIVIIAILSAPTSLQQFGFEQPNIAVLHFPFVWLPAFIVPLVLFSHLAMIRRLLAGKK